MLAGQLLGQFEAIMVIDAGDPSDHSGVYQHLDIAIGAALGKANAQGQDLRNGEGPSGCGHCGHQGLAHRGIPLLEAGKAPGNLLVNGRRRAHSVSLTASAARLW
jgi:hypothetical protein